MPELNATEGRKSQLSVFLDSNIILQFQRGSLKRLFEPKALMRFHYVINPLILQEVIFYDSKHKISPSLDEVRKNTELVQIDMEKALPLIRRAQELRNRVVHSNDLLSLGSASECDYFVTDDNYLRQDWDSKKPKIISSTEFERMLDEV